MSFMTRALYLANPFRDLNDSTGTSLYPPAPPDPCGKPHAFALGTIIFAFIFQTCPLGLAA